MYISQDLSKGPCLVYVAAREGKSNPHATYPHHDNLFGFLPLHYHFFAFFSLLDRH